MDELTETRITQSARRWIGQRADLGRAVLRVGLGLVLLWFGVSILLDVEGWSGYVPGALAALAGSAVPIALVNALLHLVSGTSLVLGIGTSRVALIVFVHISVIALSLGYNEIAIRDWGLAAMALSIALLPHDRFSLERVWTGVRGI